MIGLTKQAKRAIDGATRLSKSLQHHYVGTEHLLIAIIEQENSLASKVLISNGVTKDALLKLVEELIFPGGDVSVMEREGNTPKMDQLLEHAEEEALKSGSKTLGTEHLLLAMIRMQDCAGARLLNSLDVSPQKLFGELVAGMGAEGTVYKEEMQAMNNRHKGEASSLEQYSRDLTEMALDGELDPIVGRDNEIQRVIQILSRRGKNNPCLIGEPGVGKTAIVEGLAQRIIAGTVPESVKNLRVLSLDLSGMVAGSKYRGEFEERIKKVIAEVIEDGDILLFIDEIHTLIGAGGAEGAIDASNILKPAMARGEIQILGATTISEYRKYVEKDAALERRFQPVMVEEPSPEETIEILKGVRHLYEEHHGVVIPDEACEACVHLSERYITDRFLPDKAIDLMDEAAASIKLSSVKVTESATDEIDMQLEDLSQAMEDAIINGEFDLASEIKREKDELTEEKLALEKKQKRKRSNKVITLTENDIASVVALWTKIPVSKLTEKEAERLRRLERTLHKRVIGQEEAVSAVARAVRRGRVGLKEKGRPIGSFLFLGPTGVGKTEISKALAEAIFGTEDSMIRVDMSEYMEKHSVSKMIGSPPGYVGFEEGGQLSEKVRRNPYSVILFDEIEKAHPDVFNILLQVLDDGHITDSQGRKVDFKNTIIIMTSNAGAQAIIEPKKLGFASKDDASRDHERMKSGVMEEVKRIFKPEFLNRIDETIVFRALTKDDMKEIVTLQTKEFINRCKEQMGITVTIPASVKTWVVEKSFDAKYGARPIRRKIQTSLEDVMAEEILAGNIKSNEKFKAKIKKDAVVFEKC
ncbi:MAG: ATP-dependent Clp protease ATP-binding subunit [Pseudobutyrivibrio sp.]|nr:ATP-dependent Clp protease ATP-binding subunit [Pseudobutyrivibrio sp.]